MNNAGVGVARSLRVLLPTLGSAGDVHPVIALGLALQERGHRATLLTNPLFESVIERAGLGFLPVGRLEDATAAIANPLLWHPRKGLSQVLQLLAPAVREIYQLIVRHADADTVVVAASLALGARIAQDRHAIPTVTLHLQPSVLRSLRDQRFAGTLQLPAWQPRWLKRSMFWFFDKALIDPYIVQPVNELRAQLGLAPIARVLNGWLHSPQCVLGLFPPWFAALQLDWPPHTHLVGFALWDGEASAAAWREAQAFLQAGEPPVIVTPGSAAATLHRYFAESVRAIGELGVRAMLVTNFSAQLPRTLPPNVLVCDYLPFSELLPQAAVLVHHGGIGTLAQAIYAGIPQLVVPQAHDQFDNGWRVQRLGLGQSVPRQRDRAARITRGLRELLDDQAIRGRCRQYAARIDSRGTLARACELIEATATTSACR